jgi:hypothetical protein
MWAIIKSELKYSIEDFLVVLIFPILFTVYIIIGHPLMNAEQLITIIFWPFLVGLVPLYILVKNWGRSYLVEKHSQAHNCLPISLSAISLSRIISAAIPVIFLCGYFLIVHVIILHEWQSIVTRIFYLLGSNFLIISAFLLTYDLHLTFNSTFSLSGIITGILVFIPVIVIGIIADRILFLDSAIISGTGIGIVYFIIALAVLYIDQFTFRKRQSLLV